MSKTSIEWARNADGSKGETWNPTTGCTKISPGCKHCFAERMAKRLKAMGLEKYANGFDLTVHPDALTIPLHWRKPRRIFVDSMSDLFHEDVPDRFIDRVFAVMALCPQHTFMLLTKRPDRMARSLNEASSTAWKECRNFPRYPQAWPLRNLWLGISAEDQGTADARIPDLLQCPAALHFVSLEPLLAGIDVRPYLPGDWACDCGWRGENTVDHCGNCGFHGHARTESSKGADWAVCPECGSTDDVDNGCPSCDLPCYAVSDHAALGLVIAGGESGPHARPSHPDWYRSLRDQCAAAGVPYFFKGWGSWAPTSQVAARGEVTHAITPGGIVAPFVRESMIAADPECLQWEALRRVGKKAAGNLLDGKQHLGMPEVTR